MKRLVIVGGGPAGLSAARAFREAGGDWRVDIFTDEDVLPYDRPPLTKEFLRGEKEEGELSLEDDSWYVENGVGVSLGTRVDSLDPDDETILLSGGESVAYDACVVATGSRAMRPPVPGVDGPGVHVVRDLADSRSVVSRAGDARTALVVGSGFIGCEAVASLASRGIEVTMVSMEESPQQGRLGGEVGARISSWLHDAGVETMYGATISGIRSGEDVVTVDLEDGSGLDADMVLLGAGAEPRVELLRDAGLEISGGGVPCDSSMRPDPVGAPGLFVAGDIASAYNEAAGRRLRVEHWGDALEQGRISGSAAAGRDERWSDVPGFWSTIGDHTLKYAAWGDGWDDYRVREFGDGAFTVWYGREGRYAGVLAYGRDEDYETGRRLVGDGVTFPG